MKMEKCHHLAPPTTQHNPKTVGFLLNCNGHAKNLRHCTNTTDEIQGKIFCLNSGNIISNYTIGITDNGNWKAHIRILLALTIMGVQYTHQIIYSNNFDDYSLLGYDTVLTSNLLLGFQRNLLLLSLGQ
jgi:hypothetical protein